MCTGNKEWNGFPRYLPDEIPAGVHDDEREREEKKDERVASGEGRASGEGMTKDERALGCLEKKDEGKDERALLL